MCTLIPVITTWRVKTDFESEKRSRSRGGFRLLIEVDPKGVLYVYVVHV